MRSDLCFLRVSAAIGTAGPLLFIALAVSAAILIPRSPELMGEDHAPDPARSFQDESKRRREASRRTVEALALYRLDGSRRKLQLHSEPLTQFLDPTRIFRDGTTWVWLDSGRPEAVLSLCFTGGSVLCEFLSLSRHSLQAENGSEQLWSPSPEWTPQPFPESPVPAMTRAARLSQMKLLVGAAI